jgi:prepilin-type N-terminal cleavage/methylation domain-containing protein
MRGFTLIEVLIAVLVLGLVVTASLKLVMLSERGLGQVRVIAGNVPSVFRNPQAGNQVTDTVLYLNEPFETQPNRTGTVSITPARTGWVLVNNTFTDGAASGSYGTMIDAVWDGNVFRRHEGQYFDTHHGVLWYLTTINQKHFDPIYVHGSNLFQDGYADKANMLRLTSSTYRIQNTNTACANMGIICRDNEFDGYGLGIDSASTANAISGMIVERCTFKNREWTAIYYRGTSANLSDGLLFKDLDFQVVDEFDSNIANITNNAANNTNKYGSQKIVISQSGYDPGTLLTGDVNLDGKVSLKDSTLARCYVLGLVTLTDEQKLRADVDGNGAVTLKDATLIRGMIE